MNANTSPRPRPLPTEQALRVDDVCDRFESVWRAVHKPRIEDYLGEDKQGPERTALLCELLALDIYWRGQHGEHAVPRDYNQRFPGDTALVEAIFDEAAEQQPHPESPQCVSRLGRSDTGCELSLGQRDGDNEDVILGLVRTSAPRGIRYRILRPHAKGGLGEVFAAYDEELHREVALKKINLSRVGDDETRKRFLLEAELTGQLEHPGIVPVYSLGTDGDGAPFYTMRFVRGESLSEVIARLHEARSRSKDSLKQRSMALRELLYRFITVCNAVDYAHSRGVLHRDLKPHNVMVGRYGETLLIDWGLAKATGRSEPIGRDNISEPAVLQPSGGHEPTMGALGSPQYMSPEQAAGEVGSLGATTDVYGLGAILFAVLTGEAPVASGAPDEVLERARRGEVRPPRSLNPDVPRALEAVCLKALALDPADRYPTARALAKEIEEWLADEPVDAYSESVATRLVRWARHHHKITTAAAATLLCSCIALMIGSSLLGREQSRTLKHRLRAEENYQLALATVDRFTTQLIQHQLENMPDNEPVLKQLLIIAHDYYRDFLERQNLDRSARIGLAGALNLLAAITNQIDSPSHALEYSQKAVAVQEILVRDQPLDRDLLRTLAIYLDIRGQLESSVGHPELAESTYTTAIGIYRDLASSDPSDGPCRFFLGTTLKNLGHCQIASGSTERAEQSYRDALALFDALSRGDPPLRSLPPEYLSPDYELPIHLGSAHDCIGGVCAKKGQPDLAENHYRRALEINQGLFRSHPDSQHAQFYLALSFQRLSELYAGSARWEEAEALIVQSVPQWEHLALNHPTRRSNRYGLQAALDLRCRIAKARGRSTDAEQDLLRLKALFETMASARESQPAYRIILAEVLMQLSRLEDGRNAVGQALHWSVESIAVLVELAKAYPGDVQEEMIVVPANGVDEVLSEHTDIPGASEIRARTTRAMESLRNHGHDTPGVRAVLCKLHQAQGHFFAWSHRLPEALREWKSALDFAGGPQRERVLLEQGYTLGNDTEEHERVAAIADELSRGSKYVADDYELGCLYALAVRGARSRRNSSSAESEAIVQRYAARALEQLARAESQGYFQIKDHLQKLQTNPELDALRSHEKFKALLKRCSTWNGSL